MDRVYLCEAAERRWATRFILKTEKKEAGRRGNNGEQHRHTGFGFLNFRQGENWSSAQSIMYNSLAELLSNLYLQLQQQQTVANFSDHRFTMNSVFQCVLKSCVCFYGLAAARYRSIIILGWHANKHSVVKVINLMLNKQTQWWMMFSVANGLLMAC